MSSILARDNLDGMRRKSWNVSYPASLRANENWKQTAKPSNELYLPKNINGAWKEYSMAQDQEDIW